MCTIVTAVLGSTLLMVSMIVFIGATPRPDEDRSFEGVEVGNDRLASDGGIGAWELVSAGTVTPYGASRRGRIESLTRLREEEPINIDLLDAEPDLDGADSHVVVKVYSVDPDQEHANRSCATGVPAHRSTKAGPTSGRLVTTPKQTIPKLASLDGKATDRVERKMFAPPSPPPKSIQEKLDDLESGELDGQDTPQEPLLKEQFYVDDSPKQEPPVQQKQQQQPSNRRRYYGEPAVARRPEVGSSREAGDNQGPAIGRKTSQHRPATPPAFEYSDQSSQRMLDEFFAQRNQDSLASRRQNYDWDEGHLRSRTLEQIKAHNRAVAAARKSKIPHQDYPAERTEDESYGSYADYEQTAEEIPPPPSRYDEAEAQSTHRRHSLPFLNGEDERRLSSYRSPRLGRKQRATPSSSSTASQQTHVLNTMPIVAIDGSPQYHQVSSDAADADHYHRPRPSKLERSRFHYSLPSMVINPYAAWDPYPQLNMLRFPQCAACQQNARALCGKCGMCGECCARSKCTCGCLNG